MFMERLNGANNQNPPIKEIGIPRETQKANFGLRNSAKTKITKKRPCWAFRTIVSILPLNILASSSQAVSLASGGSCALLTSTYS